MTGQYAHTIDAKGRLFIPAALRKELGQTFHITVGQDRCLSVYSDESWAAFMDKLKALSYNEVKSCGRCSPTRRTASRTARDASSSPPSCGSMRG